MLTIKDPNDKPYISIHDIDKHIFGIQLHEYKDKIIVKLDKRCIPQLMEALKGLMIDDSMTEFEKDCIHHHGRILTGKYKHYCAEWDFLPLDETCHEYEHCICFPKEDRITTHEEQQEWLKNVRKTEY